MQFTVEMKDFAGAVAVAARGMASRSTLPILSHVLVEAREGQVSVLGTDLEIALKMSAAAEVAQAGAACVPGNVLKDLLAALPVKDRLTVELGERLVTLASGPSRYELHTLPAEEFAAWPAVGQEKRLTLPGELWAKLCKRAGFAISDEISKPVLCGMLLQCGDGRIIAASTDTHRLALMAHAAETPAVTAILPARLLGELLRAAPTKQELSFTFGDFGEDSRPGVVVSCGSLAITGRLIYGQFPAWERVIPRDAPLRCSVSRAALQGALKRARTLAADTSKVMVNSNPLLGTLTLTAGGTDSGEAREEIEAAELAAWDTAFNATYLLEALAVSESDTVRIAQEGPLQPALLTDDEPAWQTVVMPMARE